MAGTIALNRTELDAFLAALADRPLRDQAMARTALHTGLRAGTLLGLRVEDVWDGTGVRPVLYVARHRLKNGNGVRKRSVTGRYIPIHPAARAALLAYIQERAGSGPLHGRAPLFRSKKGGAVRLWRWNRILTETMAAAGICTAGRSSHALRKTFCALCLESAGGRLHVVQLAMGHRHLSTLQAYLPCADTEAATAILDVETAGIECADRLSGVEGPPGTSAVE
ncbi:MAG: site-specific integrase [Opitutaceae bacterium]|nr:site-specific integrase [Opitutaceae bacterium]